MAHDMRHRALALRALVCGHGVQWAADITGLPLRLVARVAAEYRVPAAQPGHGPGTHRRPRAPERAGGSGALAHRSITLNEPPPAPPSAGLPRHAADGGQHQRTPCAREAV
jgi:hypothetical protein